MSSHLKLNPWLVVVGIVVVIVFGSMAQFGSYISTKAKPVPNKIQPGDSYPVNYQTSSAVPSVRIDLCSDSTNTACIPMAANATGSQTTIVIPGTFATGQAHINVLERDKKGTLTGKIQSTFFVTIFAPGSNTDSAGTDSTTNSGSTSTPPSSTGSSSSSSSGFLGNLFNSFTNSTSTPAPTPTPNQDPCAATDCPLVNLPTIPACPYQSSYSIGCGRQADGVCRYTLSGTCPPFPPATSAPIATPYSFKIETPFPTPAPTPAPYFYSVTIYYSFYVSGQAHLVADVLWLQQPGTRLVYRSDKETTWHEATSSFTGHATLDLTNIAVGYNSYFWIQARDNSDTPVSKEYKYYTSTPASGENQVYIVGQN